MAGSTEGGVDGGFKTKLERYLYSGEKKHVFAGFAIVGIVFGVPWFLMNRGKQHQSHQDYMDNADKARQERLSAGQPAAK